MLNHVGKSEVILNDEQEHSTLGHNGSEHCTAVGWSHNA